MKRSRVKVAVRAIPQIVAIMPSAIAAVEASEHKNDSETDMRQYQDHAVPEAFPKLRRLAKVVGNANGTKRTLAPSPSSQLLPKADIWFNSTSPTIEGQLGATPGPPASSSWLLRRSPKPLG